jgi:catechol-2,3-dioxygenase
VCGVANFKGLRGRRSRQAIYIKDLNGYTVELYRD